jgi:hypothetical protein
MSVSSARLKEQNVDIWICGKSARYDGAGTSAAADDKIELLAQLGRILHLRSLSTLSDR